MISSALPSLSLSLPLPPLLSAPPQDTLPTNTTTDLAAPSSRPSSSSAAAAASSSTLAPPPSSSSAPVRPPARTTRSKLDLEPNPFEQSFSGRSSSAEAQDVKPELNAEVRVTVEGVPAVEGAEGGGGLVGEVNPDSKPLLLPSVSQLVSPENEDGPFNWSMNTPAISSLRSGPLSPAMLAGPKAASQGQAAVLSHALQFDPSNFVRTGLTPGTGLTPLSGGPASFPPPSPNTAAFLAMVTNATAAAAQTGPDGAPLPLTPGTFNTVMSQLGNTLNGPSHVNGQVVGHQPHPLANSHLVGGAAPGGGQPDYFSHRPEDGQQTHVQQQQQQQVQQQQQQHHQQQMMAQQQYHQQQQMGQQYVGQYQPQQLGGQMAQQHLVQQQQQHGGPPPDHYHKQSVAAASQAANGLFLLSQAHQEIAAREHESPPSNGMHHNGGPPSKCKIYQSHSSWTILVVSFPVEIVRARVAFLVSLPY
ncbi:hypothetical protein BDY24DRAFT_381728 [Mrakia frigida]|uniref:uncharacterized protein n=1 Tax=Mrakia frigida TaxID=29902 RepID=UPI003FCC03A0